MLSYRHWVQRFEALGPRPAYLMCSLGSIRKLSALRRFIGVLSAEIALNLCPKPEEQQGNSKPIYDSGREKSQVLLTKDI